MRRMRRMRMSTLLVTGVLGAMIAAPGPAAGATPIWTWTARLSTSDFAFNQHVVDIVADSGGVHGLFALETLSGEQYQLGLRSYSASGTLRWKRDLGKVASSIPDAGAVAVDSGGVYVVFQRPSGFALRKVRRSDGKTLWTRPVTDLAPGLATAVDIVAHAGDVFLADCRYDPTTFDHVTVVRVDGADGDIVGGPWDVGDSCFGAIHVAVSSAAIYVINEPVGDTDLVRLDHDGTKQWTRHLPDQATPGGLIADTAGVYATYTRYAAKTGFAAYIRRLTAAGTVSWTKRAYLAGTLGGGAGEPAIDSRGVYLGWLAYDKQDNDPILGVRRYASSGVMKASWTYPTTKLNLLHGLAAAGGEVYAGGRGRTFAVLHRLRD